MKLARLLSLAIACTLLATVSVAAGASPLAGPCAPGTAYDPACDVDHDGDVDIFDIQLSAGHWNQTGTWVSDNTHEHLGQTWIGSRVPVKLQSNFDGTGGSLPAALVLANTRTSGPGYGLWVDSVNANGVHVNSAGADGVYVCTAGSAIGCTASSENNGVEVGNAEDNGIFVKAAGNDGVVVSAAGDDGVYVNTATDDGLHVGVTNDDGLQIDYALTGVHVYSVFGAALSVDQAAYGLYVSSAGSPSATNPPGLGGIGVNVDGAEHYGVRVGWSDGDGVYVSSAGEDGVDARTSSLTGYGGSFSNAAGGGAALYAIGGGNDAPDLILGGTTLQSGDDGRIYSQLDSVSSDILLFSNDNVHIHLDEDNNNANSGFAIINSTGTTVWSISESGLAVAGEGSAAVVDGGDEGQQLVYAVHSPQNWLEDFGSSRLVAGEAVVALDSAFAKVASHNAPYHVFLTPLGDCPLYVAEKAAANFTVRALGGAKCSIAFDYRIVGLRLGYETVRMEQFVEPTDD